MRGGGGFGRAAEFTGRGICRARRDIEGDIMVTLEEAMRGSVRAVNVRARCAAPKRIRSKFPPGVTEGQKLRVAGRGEPAAAAARPAICICASVSRNIPTSTWTTTI